MSKPGFDCEINNFILFFYMTPLLKKYECVAMGGTFDILHIGHIELLKKSFEIGKFVIIGLSSDNLVKERLMKKINNSYEVRKQNLVKIIEMEVGSNFYEITKLEDVFGPLMFSEKVDCMVASTETSYKGKHVNEVRTRMGLPVIDIVSVELKLAQDGLPISSSRIRANEIDQMGNTIKNKK
ncbi:Glycerol-3-phosphate cytidylyltransferase [Candidatus Nitrosocosmicus oleophilus]|uniref:Glycerol-3-phosphate cytidylyltransferase n=1 Tax=Candidatus Nitrosocosmicus oleophilus TaxID=1353260 RepID=A0A654M3R6_9ARCH|nr:Glycerol-3-phosphate cytidylyltransferase [Candidatus Nitrosocosmicus oleophilus]